MGVAFDRVINRLSDRRIVGTGSARMASCPGPGHWRGDVHPSLKISDGDGKVLLHCHGGCNTDDVLAALRLTVVDLFDAPPRRLRPGMTRGRAEAAVAAETSLPMAETLVMMMLLRRAHNITLELPDWYTPSMPQLAREARLKGDVKRLKTVLAHLAQHRWLKYIPGQGRGHKSIYLLLPGGELGQPCACKKGGPGTPLLKQEKGSHGT